MSQIPPLGGQPTHVSHETDRLIYALLYEHQRMIARMLQEGLDLDDVTENTPEGEAFMSAKESLYRRVFAIERALRTLPSKPEEPSR